MLDPTVVAACDLAVNFVFGPTATYRPIGSAADTAFSGSAVIELEVLVVIPKTKTTKPTTTTMTNGKNNAHNTNTTRVVLKHSAVRTLSKSFVTTSTSEEEGDTIKSSKKYAAALKVDQSSRNEYAFLQSYSEKLLQLPPNTIDNDGISSSNKNKNKNDDDEEEEIKLIQTKTRIPRTLYARNHPTEGITLLLESLSSFGGCGDDNDNDNDNDNDKDNDDHSNRHHSRDNNADNNDEMTTPTTTTSSSTSSGGRVTVIPLGPKLNATLEWLANFHANFLPRSLNPNTFLNDDNDNSDSDFAATKEVKEKEEKEEEEEEKKLSSLLWSIGTHLSLEKRSPIELQQLPRDLTEFVERFQNIDNDHDNENDCCCSYFQTLQAKQQGQRIQDVAMDVAHYLHPDNNPAHKTIVHGDYKQGNMFFAATATNNNNTTAVTTTATSSSSRNNGDKEIDIDIDAAHQHQEKIAVFDWQWTGPGLGATDLVYLCVMAVSDEALVDYETTILRPYHNYLIQALTNVTRTNNNKNKNVGDGTTTTTTTNYDELYPYNHLINEFKIAMIDIQRWMGGSRYKSMTVETVQKAKENIDINHGIFRRSMTRIVWIFKIVDLALDDIESGRIQLLKHK